MEGILKRKVSIFRGYQDKWFTVTADGLLKQYEKQPVSGKETPKWKMNIILAEIDKMKDGTGFKVTSNEGKHVRLKAKSEEDREKWILTFRRINKKLFPLLPDVLDESDENGDVSKETEKVAEPEPEPPTPSRISFGDNCDKKRAFPAVKGTENAPKDDDEPDVLKVSHEELLDKFKNMTIAPKRRHLMVAAIDFGSAYSGCAFSFKSNFIKNPLEICVMGIGQKGLESLKVPTVLLLDPNGNFSSFGFEAEEKYTELIQDDPDAGNNWYYFSRFKMQLYQNRGLTKAMTITDITGKKSMKAVDVFAFSIEYIKESIFGRAKEQIAELEEEDVHWVVTVPAIWDEAARQFMIDAANKAGIDEENLTLALEPEAAALCCKCLEIQKKSEGKSVCMGSFETGARFLVVDLGGGTVDITANEVLETGQLKEIHSATGGPWGGNTINTAIWRLLREIFDTNAVKKFVAEYRDDYLELARTIELKKRTVKVNEKLNIEIPRTLMVEAKKINPDMISSKHKDRVKLIKNKLQINPEVLPGIFKEGIDTIVQYVQNLLSKPETKGVSTILLVGGYAACDLLRDAIKDQFKDLTVLCPLDPDVVVLKGAVIMGHMETPIVGRMAKYHYGVAILTGAEKYKAFDRSFKPLTSTAEEFHTIIRKGQPIKVNEVVTEYEFPIEFNQDEAFIRIYASEDEEPPKIITEQNCRKIGHIRIKLPRFRKATVLKIGISNDETEFKVVARDDHTGKCFVGQCRFLD